MLEFNDVIAALDKVVPPVAGLMSDFLHKPIMHISGNVNLLVGHIVVFVIVCLLVRIFIHWVPEMYDEYVERMHAREADAERLRIEDEQQRLAAAHWKVSRYSSPVRIKGRGFYSNEQFERVVGRVKGLHDYDSLIREKRLVRERRQAFSKSPVYSYTRKRR